MNVTLAVMINNKDYIAFCGRLITFTEKQE
jgi:hypothetical protein